MSLWHPVLLGAVQGLSVWPGLSRSGVTIGLALFMGWSWTDAGRFGLVTALPAAACAMLVAARGLAAPFHTGTSVPGFLASFLAGLIGLRLLMKILAARCLWPVAAYTGLLGIYALSR
jgi:undecaprenyl-diphosphatase